MDKSAQSTPSAIRKTWGYMDRTEKSIFIAKICVMVCSFGFIFGGVLVEGITYETFL